MGKERWKTTEPPVGAFPFAEESVSASAPVLAPPPTAILARARGSRPVQVVLLALPLLLFWACSDKGATPPPGSAPGRGSAGAEPGVVARVKTPFSQIIVWDDGGYRCLSFGKRSAIQSCVSRRNKLDFRYEYVRMMLAALALGGGEGWRPGRVLVLGLGGAALPTLVSRLYPGVAMDVVEIDRGVFDVAKRYMYYRPTARTRVHVQDAFQFVTRAADAGGAPSYDIIWLDCFDARHIPPHLLTDRFVTALRRILKPDGVLAANFWATHPTYPRSVRRYQRIFSQVWRIPGLHSSNHVLVGLRRVLPLSAAEVRLRGARLDRRGRLGIRLSQELARVEKLR